jgi:hypothetical protein
MTRRTLLLLATLVAVGGVVAYLFAPAFDDARVFRPVDFMEYQTAGRATLAGENPYDGAVMYRYQSEIQAKLPAEGEGDPGDATRYADPIMMWNPPWTLPLTLPLGAMHWRIGQLLWAVAQLVSVVASAAMLWRLFGGDSAKVTVAVGLAVAFAPTLFLLLLGQISGFLLLGVVGFMWFEVRREPTASALTTNAYLAGLLAALTAIKPHLLVPFALLLVLNTLRGGRTWRVVVAGGLALVAFGLMPMLWNPEVWKQYLSATAAQSAGTHNTPNEWMHPTLGYWLRNLHPDRPFALMFLPLLVALPVVISYWWVRRKEWNRTFEMPRVVLASLLTAPYGAWGFDLVLLLVPVVRAAVWVANDPRSWVRLVFLSAFTGVNLLALFTLRFENSMANWWLTPVVAVGYVLAEFVASRERTRPDCEMLPAGQRAEVLPS